MYENRKLEKGMDLLVFRELIDLDGFDCPKLH
jgi:hypothetical protein